MARAVGEVLTALGERPVVAAGHSAGLSVLLRMTVDGLMTPQRLVGFCPALIAPPAWYVAFVAPLLGFLVESGPVADGAARLASGTRLVEQMLASTGSRLTEAQRARYRALCATPEHVHAALTMMSRWDLPALRRDLGSLRASVHLVAARGDRWIPVGPLERAARGMPGMTWQVEDGGHLLPEERPEVVTQTLVDIERQLQERR
ncbi:MAG: alpha/beta fold hydrolase [Gemmatimonas sp.]